MLYQCEDCHSIMNENELHQTDTTYEHYYDSQLNTHTPLTLHHCSCGGEVIEVSTQNIIDTLESIEEIVEEEIGKTETLILEYLGFNDTFKNLIYQLKQLKEKL